MYVEAIKNIKESKELLRLKEIKKIQNDFDGNEKKMEVGKSAK